MWLVDDDATLPPASQHRYLVLTEDLPLADAAPWTCTKGSGCSAEELHARGRQHVDHLNRLRQRLASGVALARVLNRTLVLPTFYCYCDKFWHRLHACAIADAADGSQPLPFICPMDHVRLDPSPHICLPVPLTALAPPARRTRKPDHRFLFFSVFLSLAHVPTAGAARPPVHLAQPALIRPTLPPASSPCGQASWHAARIVASSAHEHPSLVPFLFSQYSD